LVIANYDKLFLTLRSRNRADNPRGFSD